MDVIRKPGESAHHLRPSELAQANSPANARYTYTGELRVPVKGEFVEACNNFIYFCNGVGVYSIGWIIKAVPKVEPVNHVVTMTNGFSIKAWSFMGDVDWARLERDLKDEGAVRAIISPSPFGSGGGVRRRQGFVCLYENGLASERSWTYNPGLMGDHHLANFKGWWYPEEHFDDIIKDWNRRIEKTRKLVIPEMQRRLSELNDIMRKLVA